MKISLNYHTSCTSFHPPLVVYNLKLEPGWGGFLSACLLQIVLKFIASTHRPRRETLKSIFKRNCSQLLRIEPFRKSPFCCVQYLPLVFICILSHSNFYSSNGAGAATFVGWSEIRKSHQQIQDIQRFGVIGWISWCLFVASVFIKKLTSICW